MEAEIQRNVKHNWVVNILDGSFFGMALGFASFVTILPLFVSSMTDSAILIGLIPAIHSMGWQLPQLLTAGVVARQKRYKPMVLLMTIHERVPFLVLALVAWYSPRLGTSNALLLTFIILVWQGFGGGFTATAWQSMIGKIIPSDQRGTFYGIQSSAANLLSSPAAIIAGLILSRFGSPLDFALCFLLAGAAMTISWFFIAQTREPAHAPPSPEVGKGRYWSMLAQILRQDPNFRWFILVRGLSQISVMGFAFFTVYAVRYHGMSEVEVGVLTAILLAAQIALNPIMGWLGDHWSHRGVMELGLLAAVCSAVLAWWAPDATWFYLVFVLAGAANVAIWTIALAMILEFGPETDRPAYIGLGNTLVAPFTFLAPVIGGWLADRSGYPVAFLASAFVGVITTAILHVLVRDPKRLPKKAEEAVVAD